MLGKKSPLRIGYVLLAALFLTVLVACETTGKKVKTAGPQAQVASSTPAARSQPVAYAEDPNRFAGLANSCATRIEQQQLARIQEQWRERIAHRLAESEASDLTLIAEINGDDIRNIGQNNLGRALLHYLVAHSQNTADAPIAFTNDGTVADLENATQHRFPYFVDGQPENYYPVQAGNLSIVPTSAIHRVEIFRLEADEEDDAYAGILNIILLDEFTGTSIATLRHAVSGASGSLGFTADDDDEDESFIITGSRIARVDVASANPVTIISGGELRSTGESNLGQSMRQVMPSPPPTSEAAPQIGGVRAPTVQNPQAPPSGSIPAPSTNPGDINTLDELLRAVRLRRVSDTAANEAPEQQFRSTRRSEMTEDDLRALRADLQREWIDIQATRNGPNRENYEDQVPNPFQVVVEAPVSTFSADVDTASYANMRRILSNCRMPQRGAIRTEELVNYFTYDYASTRRATRPFAPTVWVTPTPWNEATQLLHIGIRGYEIPRRSQPLMNLVFLVDVSGSMGSRNKLPLVQASLRLLVEEMRPNDTISLVVYAGRTAVVLEPTRARNRDVILAAIDNLRSGGSTAGAAGIDLAYQMAEANFDETRVNRVILSTDGDFNVGIRDRSALRDYIARKRETGIYFTYLGFGAGNYNDAMAQTLAQAGNGNASYIDSLDEARKVLVDEMRSTLIPIADDVKYQIEFNPAHVAEYRLVGYETRMLRREDFNNDLVDAGDVGSGHTVTALYEIVPVGSSAVHFDPLRYQQTTEASSDAGGNELAFLRMRYKMPGEDTSHLIERPIMINEVLDNMDDATDDARFAAAVAAFGQYLRGDPYLPDTNLAQIHTLAASGLGDDEAGRRAEFLDLIETVQVLRGEVVATEADASD